MSLIKDTDMVMIVDVKDRFKRYIHPVSLGKFSTKRGELDLAGLVGKRFGITIKSHLGQKFLILKPTLHDMIMQKLKRQTQIVYPKETGYLSLWLGLTDGMRVFECGSGSGATTAVMANMIAPSGKIVTYEIDDRFHDQARKNIAMLGMDEFVEFHHRDIAEGIDGGEFDAAFIDLREPWLALDIIHGAMAGGAPIAFVLPTTNQVQMLIDGLERHGGFVDIDAGEIFHRHFKPVAERLRPTDRMVAHTTYFITARVIEREPDEVPTPPEEIVIEDDSVLV